MKTLTIIEFVENKNPQIHCIFFTFISDNIRVFGQMTRFDM